MEKSKIHVTEIGFEVLGPKANRSPALWSKITLINVFKRDLFTVDLVCLEFQQDGLPSTLEIDEEMEGYESLITILPDKFEGFDRNWFSKVSKPAFAPCLTEVWRKK